MTENTKNKSRILLLCRTALLAASGIVLSAFEAALPDFPFILPGIKLGLANIAVMLGIEVLGFSGALCVTVVKAGFALITRGAVAGIMSFCGGVLSFLVMYTLSKCKKPRFGSIGIGIAGAFSHNMGQLSAAAVLVGNAVFGYGAALGSVSLLTGLVTGLAAGIILRAVPVDKLA